MFKKEHQEQSAIAPTGTFASRIGPCVPYSKASAPTSGSRINLHQLERLVDRDDSLLTLQFAAGEVSAKAFQHRSRVIRQDRARLSRYLYKSPADGTIETAKGVASVSMLVATALTDTVGSGAAPAPRRPPLKHLSAFRSAAEEVKAVGNDQESWENEGGRLRAALGGAIGHRARIFHTK